MTLCYLINVHNILPMFVRQTMKSWMLCSCMNVIMKSIDRVLQ